MNTNRENEMLASIKSFSKDKYRKDERLSEMLALQQEFVELTFNGKHASTADLKIWDVEKHLEQLNQDCGNVADEELQRFKEESKIFCNLIKAEISGNMGETKAYRTLCCTYSSNIILKNVELSDGKRHTELDIVVVTPSVVTIVEVKNTKKNIFIDQKGNYYRTGEYLRWDCNIAEKMTLKEELLKKVFADEGINHVQIKSVIVFTNNRIEVQNKYPRIRTCFISQLAYTINDFKNSIDMSKEEMEYIAGLIKRAGSMEDYSFEFDVAQYKRDFVTVMTVLEEASAKTKEPEHKQEVVKEKKMRWVVLKKAIASKYAGYVGSAVAAVVLTAISTKVATDIKKEVS